jgi:hypothetical protein
LADPLAITAGSLFVLTAIAQRRWPDWRPPGLNGDAITATFAIMIALLVGWASFGWTAWAFTSKFLGWFVLLGYAATGALLVTKAPRIGSHALLRTFAAAGAAVALVEIGLAELKSLGFPILESISPVRSSGLAANPNAFAFQMVLVSCVSLVAFRSRRLIAVLVAIAVVALWLSASRAGLMAMASVIAAAAVLMPRLRHTMASAILLAVAGLILLEISAWVPIWSGNLTTSGTTLSFGSSGAAIPLRFGLAAPVDSSFSNSERWQTILDGLSLFTQHPLYGAGLGAFAEKWRLSHGHVEVIHSTPLWLLAELGLIGATVMALPFVRIIVAALPPAARGEKAATLAILCCLAFVIMALVHEMLYQRPFWLLLGASLAAATRSSDKGQRLVLPETTASRAQAGHAYKRPPG